MVTKKNTRVFPKVVLNGKEFPKTRDENGV